MAQITQQGALNTTALVVPDLYVQIVPPQNLVINGVPTNIVGIVGTAQWGPVNQPVIVGTMQQYAAAFGAIQNRANDLGTATAIAIQQGASNFRLVRVTDGTDVKATIPLVGTTSVGVVLTALYSGSLGNSITAALATGTKANSWKLTVGLPGQTPEVYDNLTGSGATLWANLVSAVANGTGPLRGPSNLITAAVTGSYSSAAAAASVTLAGGTDGVASITTANLIGTDATASAKGTGMYALRSQGCSIGMIADLTDNTAWATITPFALAEGIYFMVPMPAGAVISNGTTGSVDVKNSAGLDTYAVKLIHGDWVYWNDTVNGLIRLVSPQAFFAGMLANLAPHQSSLNKPMYGVVGTQRSGLPGANLGTTYSTAELQALFSANIDVICNPVPGGSYFGARLGHNSSSNAAISGDNYTRMTNYLARTVAAGMGQFVGQVINPSLLNKVQATLTSFLNNLLQQGILGYVFNNANGNTMPFSVICNASNNPFSRTSLGYLQADVAVTYQAINEKFLVNLQGGQTVITAVNAGTAFGNQA